MEKTQESWPGKVGALPRRLVQGFIAQVETRYLQLKNRYGPRYTRIMVAAAFFTLLVPLPGISLLAVAVIVAVAEVHHAISKRDGPPKTNSKKIVMSVNCDAMIQ